MSSVQRLSPARSSPTLLAVRALQRPTLRQGPSPVAAKDLCLLLPGEIITRLLHGPTTAAPDSTSPRTYTFYS
jgi:hypothetical protein